MLIGICGKSGSGKSTLANKILETYDNDGIHLDIDKIGHKVLLIPEVKEELVNNFGESILTDGAVDRKKLGRIVFDSEKEMDKLTDITWKHMQEEIDKCIESYKDKIIILDWLLLPKSKYFEMCDVKILLDISYEVRKQRAINRDNITEEAFELRDKAGLNYDSRSFDYVLTENDEVDIKRMVNL